MEKKVFIKQTACPENGDKWYTRKCDGGISLAQYKGSPQAWKGSTLANCVGYSWGRFAYLEDNPDCRVGCALGTDYPADAWAWYKNSIAQGYEVGDKPKLGAVAVWSKKNGKGHVCNVEDTYPDDSWDSSESGYNTRPVWFTRHYDSNSYRKGYTFIGFIYPKYEFVKEDKDTLKVGDLVKIVSTGNSNSLGSGRTAYGIGYKRKILHIYEGRPYPYQVGTVAGTTGFYKANALKKI